MLGIIFTGGEGPAAQDVRRLLDTEARGALFVAADSGLEAAEKAGVRPDWIIGDMDSLSDPSRLAGYPQDRVIRHKTSKDYTDTELASYLASEKGCSEIWIIGGGGGRIDHIFGIRSLLERDVFPYRWISGNADIRCLDAGAKSGLSLEIAAGELVSVFPLGNGPWKATSCGLKWPLNDLIWNRGFFGLSNVALEGNFSINAQTGRFMVILQGLNISLCGAHAVVAADAAEDKNGKQT